MKLSPHSSRTAAAAMRRRSAPLVLALFAALGSLPSQAALDASDLGRDLTPLGGEKAANKDGSIPAWSGETGVTGAFTPGKQLRMDAWRFKGDKPLYAIEAANIDQHADKLSPGQQALLKAFPGMKMEVYPSRRTCSAPSFVAENTKKNVGFAKVGADGWTLKDAYVPGIPFPLPQSGIEVMWNQKQRYRGVGASFNNYTYVSPRRGQGEWINSAADQTFYWHWGLPGSRKISEVGNVMSQTYFAFKKPVALAGQAAIISDYFDKPGTDTYYYFPGQRRVRRMPAYAYDAPQVGFENQYAIDDTQVIMGALDRFDWKLVGKKEMLVPYNSFGAFDFKGDPAKIITPNGLASSNRRYELHRVWVVEATVKQGLRHTSPRRTYYIDEDSWNAVLAEDYDAQGKLTKVREGFLIPVFELGACDVSAFSQYNVLEGRVVLDFGTVGAAMDAVYSVQPSNPAMKSDFYTPDNLRSLSER